MNLASELCLQNVLLFLAGETSAVEENFTNDTFYSE